MLRCSFSRLAAAIERFSEHPLAHAIVKGVEEREITHSGGR